MNFKQEQIDFIKSLTNKQLKELHRWCSPGSLLGGVTCEIAKREENSDPSV